MIGNMSANSDSLDSLHTDMEAAHMAPTWKYISSFITREPNVSYRPWLWKWDDVIPLLLRAGKLITPERGAERRSMEHVNPDLPHSYSASHTIATAFQLVCAGEHAPAHRHAAGAIRFAARSCGGHVYTKVQGEKLLMEENDLLLTPSGMWHEHRNETNHDIIWLDVLDFPLVNLLQSSWFEPGEHVTSIEKPEGFSNRMLGLYRPPATTPYPESHPVLRYPWVEMKEALHSLQPGNYSDYDGALLEYVNPLNSGPTLPTLMCRAQLLRKNFHSLSQRSTSSKVYFVIGGGGYSVINGIKFSWKRGDVFVVPPWSWHEHVAEQEDSYLFSVTDEPVLNATGLYKWDDSARQPYQEIKSAF